MKEKIKKLFQGTKEDMIIACELIAQLKEHPNDFILSLGDAYNHQDEGDSHPRWATVEDIEWDTTVGTFYYKFKDNSYILCSPGYGVCFCFEAYADTIEIINHS